MEFEGDLEGLVGLGCAQELEGEGRDGWHWFGFWDLFVTDAGVTVVGRYEEVVSADCGFGVVWWAFGFYLCGEGVPFELFFVWEGPPCCYGSFVD